LNFISLAKSFFLPISFHPLFGCFQETICHTMHNMIYVYSCSVARQQFTVSLIKRSIWYLHAWCQIVK
jgi:uncharacterized protein YbbC (DUF1343 family)